MGLPEEIQTEDFESFKLEADRLIEKFESMKEAIDEGDGEQLDKLTEHIDKESSQMRMNAIQMGQKVKQE